MQPRPVASGRPRDPPRFSGLPVTTAVTVWRLCMEYVSMIQAMVCSFVFTSGAGTSLSGPMKSKISAVYRRVMRSSSICERIVRVADDAALGATEWDIYHCAFPGHPRGQRAHFVERHVRRKTNAALRRTASDGMLHAITVKTSRRPSSS